MYTGRDDQKRFNVISLVFMPPQKSSPQKEYIELQSIVTGTWLLSMLISPWLTQCPVTSPLEIAP